MQLPVRIFPFLKNNPCFPSSPVIKNLPCLEKEMATHSSVLAWRIPGTGAWWAAVCDLAAAECSLENPTMNDLKISR